MIGLHCHVLSSVQDDQNLELMNQNCNFQGGPSSVRFGYGLGMERFKRFRFSVLTVPLQKGFLSVFQYSVTGKEAASVPGKTVPAAFGFGKNDSDGSGFQFRFGSWATLNSITASKFFQSQYCKSLC